MVARTTPSLLVRSGHDFAVAALGVKQQSPPGGMPQFTRAGRQVAALPTATYADRPLFSPLCEPRFRRR
jgi:hypothetical protein